VFITKFNPGGQIVYSALLRGNNGSDYATGLAVDVDGSVYVTGYVNGDSTFPVTPGAYQQTLKGTANAFVSKVDPAGDNLVYSTYLGGSVAEGGGSVANFPSGGAITLDALGQAVVTGWTRSADFPTKNPAQGTLNGGGSGQTSRPRTGPLVPETPTDAYVTKLNVDGSNLVFSTFLGGGASEQGTAVATDSTGGVSVTGWSNSTNFPTTPGAYQTSNPGGQAVFVTHYDSNGARLWSTLVGGTTIDSGQGIAVDPAGNGVCVTGGTLGSFPTTPGAYQTTAGGGQDAFVLKLKGDGSALVYSTLLGGSADEQGNAITIDSSGLTEAMCGATMTFGIVSNGCPGGIGSTSKTSSAAAPR
jgi:hypothetical protein